MTEAWAEQAAVDRFRPVTVGSPQSNGMAEAFVKTFKRDYVYVHDGPDAQTVLAQLPRWVEDYNEIHSHKALRLRSPRDFIRSLQQPAAVRPDRGNSSTQARISAARVVR